MKEWMEGLPEDIRESEALTQFDDVGALASSYLETKSLQGKSIRLPTDEADDAMRAEVFTKIQKHWPDALMKPEADKPWNEQTKEFKEMFGIPDELEGYRPPEDLKGINDEMCGKFREMAFKSGMSKETWDSMINQMAEENAQTQAQFTEIMEGNISTVKNRLGAGGYESAMEGIALMTRQFQDEDHPIDMDDPATKMAMAVPSMQLMMNNMRKAFSGDGPQGEFVATKGEQPTLQELNNEYNDFKNTEQHKKFMAGQLRGDEHAHVSKKRLDFQEKIRDAKEI